jgi:hypothetical protein
MNFEFSWRIFKNTRISDFMKILQVVVDLFHVDGQTDTTKLRVAFRSFANPPKREHMWQEP